MKICRLAALVVLAGTSVSMAQPTINGLVKPYYGPAKWTNTTPTSVGDNTNVGCLSVGAGVRVAVNNSNIAGVPGGDLLLSALQQADAAAVATGMEIAIPMSQLGAVGSTIRLTGWVNGGGSDFLSNQVIGGFTTAQGNLGGDGNGTFNGTAAIDWTTKAGDQFVSVAVPAGVFPAAAITIDGSRDAAYPAPQFVQTNGTNFGNGTAGAIDCPGGGSEIDNVSISFVNADLGAGAQNYMVVFIGGNLECNFNRLNLMIDNGSGTGSNIIPAGLPGADGLAKHTNMKFDAPFAATHYMSLRNGNTASVFGLFADFAQVQVGGFGGFIGGSGAAAPGITGVGSLCPPSAFYATGSELGQLYARLDRPTNRLNVLVTGNLKENEFLHLFLDTTAGGQNAILSNNVAIGIADGGAGVINRFGPVAPGGPALTFDAGFAPDYWLSTHFENSNRQVLDAALLRTNGRATIGNVPGVGVTKDYGTYQGQNSGTEINFDGTNFTTQNALSGNYQDGFATNLFAAYAPREMARVLQAFINANGGDAAYFAPALSTWLAYAVDPITGARPNLIRSVFNNSNILGVTATGGTGATATAGFEYSIDLGELGYTGGQIRLAGFIANSATTQIYNQVIGAGTGASNLGDPRTVDFNALTGRQFIVVFCPQDFNQSGDVSVQDIFDFLAAWFAGNLSADFNGSGTVSVQDIFDFLAGWFSGNC